MLDFLRLPSFKDLADDALAACRRFPFAALAAVGATAVALSGARQITPLGHAISTGQLYQFFVLAFFATLLSKLVGERLGAAASPVGGVKGAVLALLLVAPAAFVVLGGGPGPRHAPFGPAPLFLIAGYIFLLMAVPYRAGEAGNALLWEFNRVALTGAVFGLTVAVLLGAGVGAFLLALEELFGVDVPNDLYEDVWAICLNLIWPWRAMTSLPKTFEAPEGDYCPRWIGFLACYVHVPLASVYLIVLYAFALKILIEWDLPRAQIAWLVCWFALVGVATKLTIYPLRETGHRALRVFDRIFFPALFLPAVLLAIAVGVRLDSYGWTEERYILVLLAVWLFAIAAVFTLGWRPLVLAPLILGLFLTLASFGPWGAVDFSMRSQTARLAPLLTANGILSEDRLTKSEQPVAFETARQITSIVSYLSAEHRRPAFIEWLNGREAGLDLREDWRSDQFVKAIGLRQKQPKFTLKLVQNQPVSVDGFGFMVQQGLYPKATARDVVDPSTGRSYRIAFDSETATVAVRAGSGQAVTFDLGKLAEALDAFSGTGVQELSDPRQLSLDAAAGDVRVRLVLTHVVGTRKENAVHITMMNGIFLFDSR